MSAATSPNRGPGLLPDSTRPGVAIRRSAAPRIIPRRTPRTLKVGGMTPFTATDYPGKLSAVIFVQGCPWRCGYCHNPHLQPRTPDSPIAWDEVMALLSRRVGLIDAVVFSGGEPTMDPGLAPAIEAVRALGYRVGLHTGGTHPHRLEAALPLLDWVGLDIKAEFEDYASVTRVTQSGAPAQRSLEMLLSSGIDYECRTTAHPDLLSPEALLSLGRRLNAMGVVRYALQVFRPQGCADEALNETTIGAYPGEALVEHLTELFPEFILRRA